MRAHITWNGLVYTEMNAQIQNELDSLVLYIYLILIQKFVVRIFL